MGHFANFALPLPGRVQSNQRAELAALLRVVRTDPRPLEVRADSRYVQQGWLRHALWRETGWRNSLESRVSARTA